MCTKPTQKRLTKNYWHKRNNFNLLQDRQFLGNGRLVELIVAVLMIQTILKSTRGKLSNLFLKHQVRRREAPARLFHSVHGPRRRGILPLCRRHDCSPCRPVTANGATMGVRTLAPTVLRGRRHTALWSYSNWVFCSPGEISVNYIGHYDHLDYLVPGNRNTWQKIHMTA